MESIALHRTEGSPDYGVDLDLARRCASGDERALREVFVAHEPLLRELVYRNLGSREDAEELVATTILRFWRSAHRYRGSSSLRSYLARIALNLCHDAGRKRRPMVAPEPPVAPAEEHPWADRVRGGVGSLDRRDTKGRPGSGNTSWWRKRMAMRI